MLQSITYGIDVRLNCDIHYYPLPGITRQTDRQT